MTSEYMYCGSPPSTILIANLAQANDTTVSVALLPVKSRHGPLVEFCSVDIFLVLEIISKLSHQALDVTASL